MNKLEQQSKLSSFDDACEKMRETLYKNELYREGSVYITYDRQDHEFHVCESDGTSGTAADEYPTSEYYCQTSIISVDINGLDENFSECISYDRKAYRSKKAQRELWESLVDTAISNQVDTLYMNENEKAALFELDEIESGRYPSELSYNE